MSAGLFRDTVAGRAAVCLAGNMAEISFINTCAMCGQSGERHGIWDYSLRPNRCFTERSTDYRLHLKRHLEKYDISRSKVSHPRIK